eukprot:TRINITY_DN11959_c0_g1_i2.p1 TRINITY_DN11959_c0_g1~~TRINITY_DN11959_c0_g1_i2.p1  ORF type:complete len:256 (+),score=37.66 TRINITY_DN11959_c0_g1_i2:54-821(+)
MAAAGPETTPEAIRGRLVHALVSAQQAVSADTEGDTDTALPLYSEASAVLEQILPFVPEGHAKVMAHNSSIYADRAAELRKEMIELAAGAGSAGVVPAFPVQFVERPPPPLPTESVPGTIRRPFWLMRQVSLSMQTGAYLTSAIFVPKAVWYQPGAHTIVKAVGAKIRYCENLCGLIERLLEAGTSSVPVLVRALDAFTRTYRRRSKRTEKQPCRASTEEPSFWRRCGTRESGRRRCVRKRESQTRRITRTFRGW